MRNRAKCRQCSTIIESFHEFDYVECKCSRVGITGGTVKYRVLAYDFKDVIRIDDNDKEIEIKFEDNDENNRNDRPNDENTDIDPIHDDMGNPSYDNQSNLLDNRQNTTREDLLKELGLMMDNIEGLPQHVMIQPVNHYDLYSFMLVVSSLFRAS